MFKGFLNEFKKFAMRGNVIDMAVGLLSVPPSGRLSTLWSKTLSCRRSACCWEKLILPICLWF